MINEANLSAVYDQKVSGFKVAAPRTRKREQIERPIKGAEKQPAPSYIERRREGGRIEKKGSEERERERERGRERAMGRARESERAT